MLTAGSYATVPNRYELLTGRFVCTYTRGWEPLPAHEIVLAQALGDAGYTSMFILDTPNLLRDGYHYDRGYTAWHWIRGQEGGPLPDIACAGRATLCAGEATHRIRAIPMDRP